MRTLSAHSLSARFSDRTGRAGRLADLRSHELDGLEGAEEHTDQVDLLPHRPASGAVRPSLRRSAESGRREP